MLHQPAARDQNPKSLEEGGAFRFAGEAGRLFCEPLQGSRRLAALVILLVSAAPTAALAAPIDGMEHVFGATRIHAALGHGKLTAALSKQGELTVLRWPGPSFFEHLNYKTALGADARKKPLFGAKPNEGSFAGLVITSAAGTTLAWLRDSSSFDHQQRYASDDSDTLLTTYRSKKLGITVEETTAIDPRRAVLGRSFHVRVDSGSPDRIALVYYANLAPTVEKLPFVPSDQYAQDYRRDYALVYDHDRDALLGFSVADRPPSLIAGVQGGDRARISKLLTAVAKREGSYIAIGGSRPSSGFQCGVDSEDSESRSSTSSTGGSGGGTPTASPPADAYRDATDGKLSSSRGAAMHTTGALMFELGKRGGELSIFVVAGKTGAAARRTLHDAKKAGFADLRRASDAAWHSWLKSAHLPDTDDAARQRLAKRALISIRTATDAATGAIVASVSTQPPYNVDWPRDGAFFNYALDVAGKSEMVARHNQLYGKWQREKDGQDKIAGKAPAGSFAMNYYPDGTPGGPIPFEIDHVGLVLWSFYRHATFLDDDSARRSYLESLWTPVARAADLLVSCKDEQTKLQCEANEDDVLGLTISLHGATTTALGLDSAVRIARYLGHGEQADRWLERLRELRSAIDREILVEGKGYAGTVTGQKRGAGGGPMSWTLWPVELRSHDDPRMKQTAESVVADFGAFFAKKTAGGAYHAKATLALAMHYTDHRVRDSAGLERIKRWIDLLVKELPTEGTYHFGEAYLYADLDKDGVKRFHNRVAIPHVWEATLVYLSLMAAYSPKRMRPAHIAQLEPDASGCSAAGAGGDEQPAETAGGALLLALWAGWRWARHRRTARDPSVPTAR